MSESSVPGTPEESPKPRSGRRWLLVFLAVPLLVLAALLISYILLQSEPSYWRAIDADDPEMVFNGEAVESHVVSEMTAPRPSADEWTLALEADRINAWFATRLPRWLANQGVDREIIEAIPHAMIHIDTGRIELAAQLRLSGIEQVVRFVYEVESGAENDPVRLQLAGVYAGRLRVPMDALIARVTQQLDTDAKERIESLKSIPLVLILDDGRSVKVTGATLEPGRAAFTCQTLLRGKTNP